LSKSRSRDMAVPLGTDAKSADMYVVNGPAGALVHCPSNKERDCSGGLPTECPDTKERPQYHVGM